MRRRPAAVPQATMDVVDRELAAAGGPFFLGADLSLADITFVPMLERIAASLLYYKGCAVRGGGRWPAVERWFEALERRPTYLGTKSGAERGAAAAAANMLDGACWARCGRAAQALLVLLASCKLAAGGWTAGLSCSGLAALLSAGKASKDARTAPGSAVVTLTHPLPLPPPRLLQANEPLYCPQTTIPIATTCRPSWAAAPWSRAVSRLRRQLTAARGACRWRRSARPQCRNPTALGTTRRSTAWKQRCVQAAALMHAWHLPRRACSPAASCC